MRGKGRVEHKERAEKEEGKKRRKNMERKTER